MVKITFYKEKRCRITDYGSDMIAVLCYHTDFIYKNGLEICVNRIAVFNNELRILHKPETLF